MLKNLAKNEKPYFKDASFKVFLKVSTDLAILISRGIKYSTSHQFKIAVGGLTLPAPCYSKLSVKYNLLFLLVSTTVGILLSFPLFFFTRAHTLVNSEFLPPAPKKVYETGLP